MATGKTPSADDRQADRTARARARWVRWVVLGVVLVAMTTIVTLHLKSRGDGRWAGVDFLCPFGGLETLYSLLAGDGFLRRTAASSVILLVGMLAMAVVYRRSFCGAICPLGTLQGIFGAAGRRLFGRRRPTVPAAVDRVARYLKYVVLAVFAFWTWQAAELGCAPTTRGSRGRTSPRTSSSRATWSDSSSSWSHSPARWCTSASSASTSAPPARSSPSSRR